MRILLVVAVALVVYFLLRKKRVASAPSEASKTVDAWLKDALPAVLDAHLAAKGVERSGNDGSPGQVARSLAGDPDPQVVSALEQHVRNIEIEYQRDPHNGGAVDVCAHVRFEDNTEETVRTRLAWSEVPAAIRDDFDHKATSRAFRAWHFPWRSSW